MEKIGILNSLKNAVGPTLTLKSPKYLWMSGMKIATFKKKKFQFWTGNDWLNKFKYEIHAQEFVRKKKN